MDDEHIASAWLENCRNAIAFGTDSKEVDVTFWAYSELDKFCSIDPNRALRIIRLIVTLNPDERVLYNLAAGPMEDLLVRNGSLVIDQIAHIADTDAAFLRMFAGVWPERMSPEIQARIRPLIERAEVVMDKPSHLN